MVSLLHSLQLGLYKHELLISVGQPDNETVALILQDYTDEYACL